jgi:hypothetical protein
MTTADERLARVLFKIDRAKKHTADLDTDLKAFYRYPPLLRCAQIDLPSPVKNVSAQCGSGSVRLTVAVAVTI